MVVNLKNESQQIMDRKNEQLSQIMSQKRLIFQNGFVSRVSSRLAKQNSLYVRRVPKMFIFI